jgi:tetratricopeptide (TPR) repeat protein
VSLATRLAGAALGAILVFAAPSARASDDEAADRAEALADEAYARFSAGNWTEALDLYVRAYEAAPAARILLNMADIWAAHDRDRALAYYRQYLDSPDAEPDLARRARAYISPPAPAPVPETKTPLNTWAFITGGIGLAAVATGAVLALVAKSKNDEAERSCTGQACTDPRALTLTDQALTAARAADVAFVVGGVLLAGGAVMLVVAPSPRGITVSGSFR